MTRTTSAADMQPNNHNDIAALRERLARTELIFNEMEQTARTGGYILDIATQTLFWSPGMYRIYETDPASFVPSVEAVARFYSPETARRLQQNRQRLLDLSAREFSIDLDVRTARGSHICVHAISRSEVINGRVTRIFGTAQDITERMRAELALLELEEHYRLIYENSSEAILFTGPDGTVYSANPEACRILGRSEAEIIAAGRSGIIDLKDPRLSHALEERRRTGHFKGELTFLKADGTPFPTEVSTKLFLDSQGHERTSMFIRDISEKKQAERLLRQSNEDLRLLSNHLTTVRENERTLIAREVHDEFGQIFTALKMEVMALLRSQSAATDELPPRAYSILQMIEAGIKSVQQISSSLRPRLLDDFGLIAAIEWQAEEFQKRTRIPVRLMLPKEDLAISKDISTAVFRIIQESLTNIARHAGATAIAIRLEYEETAGSLVFTIHDNGRGITEAELADTHSFGLIGIRERLRALGGQAEFTNHPDGGMQIRASIPMPSSDNTIQIEADNNDQPSDRR